MSDADARGFTLVELLVVVLLGGFIVLSIYQVLIANSRTYAVSNAQIQGQQALRAGLDVLFGELREVSPAQGDILAMAQDSITIRTPRAFGLACEVDYDANPPEVTAYRMGPFIQSGDSIFIFADNETDRASDDVWLTLLVRTSDTTDVICADGAQAQTLSIPGLDPTGNIVQEGASVRAFETYTYGLYSIGGESYLGRRLSTAGSPDPLVGPLLPARGVGFRYLNSLGQVTTVATQVAQIELVLRYQSQVLDSRNQPVRDSIVARVYPRN